MVRLAAVAVLVSLPAAAAEWDDCMQNGDIPLKIAACTTVIDAAGTAPRDRATAQLHRGYAHRRDRAWEAARADIDAHLAARPDSHRGQYERGMLLRQAEAWHEAVRAFDLAIPGMKDRAFAWIARGRANYRLGHFWSAAQDYGEAIRLDPDGAIAYDYRAEVRCKQGRPDEAVADWRVMHRLDAQRLGPLKTAMRTSGHWEGDAARGWDPVLEGMLARFAQAGCPGR